MELLLLGTFFSFLYGLCLGSFANVCIYRMPLDISIVTPPSACPKCNKNIAWYDNIPVLSFIVLGGKCRYCKNKISFIYPFIEILTGILFAVLFYKYHFTVNFFLFCILAFSLVVISGIDYYHQVIPDIFPVILVISGLVFSVFNTTLGDTYIQRIINSALGILAGGGSLIIIALLGKFIYKKDAMGGGDIKLMAGVGAIIGWEKALFAIFLASFLGSIVGIFLMLSKKIEKKGYMPFGPFLAIASYIMLLTPRPYVLINMFLAWEMSVINKFLGI